MSQFLQIFNLFHANILSLRAFCWEVGRMADQQDVVIQENSLLRVASYLDTPVDVLKSECAAWEAQLGIDSTHPWDPFNLTVEQQQAFQELNAEIAHLARIDPKKAADAFAFLDSLTSILPIQGELLRRGALFNLWSYFENLLTDLYRVYYLSFPQILSERSLQLAELQSLSSITEAAAYLATQEAENIQRKSFTDQLKHFEKPLSIDLRPLESYRAELEEIALRRNLLAHNQGVVNSTYLKNVPRLYLEGASLKLGQHLGVSVDYLHHATDWVYICGIILLQQCWRKWEKQNLHLADYALFYKGIYQALVDERYEVARKLAEYASRLKFTNDVITHGVIINHAIALRELGERQAMQKLLRQHDIESWGLKYQIAYQALTGRMGALFGLLPKALASGELQRTNLEQWPLFKPVRADPRFMALLTTMPIAGQSSSDEPATQRPD